MQGDPIRGLVSSAMTPSGAANTVDFMWEIPNRGKRSIGVDLTTPMAGVTSCTGWPRTATCSSPAFSSRLAGSCSSTSTTSVRTTRASSTRAAAARDRVVPTATRAASTSDRSGHAVGRRHRSRRPTIRSRSACPAVVSATTRAGWRSPAASRPRSCAASEPARARWSTARCSTPPCGRCRRGSCRACSSVRACRCRHRRRAANPPIRSWASTARRTTAS